MNISPSFYEQITHTLYKGSLPPWQRTPIEEIVKEGLRREQSLDRLAYVLATAHHETARFKYDDEIGEGRGKDYGEPIWLIRRQRVAYFGRGHTQLTWLQNYAKMSVALTLELGREIDLVSKPDLASQPEYASLIIWMGMIRGMFTGQNLADHINGSEVDFVGARKIVNGTDKAELIAGYALEFQKALQV